MTFTRACVQWTQMKDVYILTQDTTLLHPSNFEMLFVLAKGKPSKTLQSESVTNTRKKWMKLFEIYYFLKKG